VRYAVKIKLSIESMRVLDGARRLTKRKKTRAAPSCLGLVDGRKVKRRSRSNPINRKSHKGESVSAVGLMLALSVSNQPATSRA
jgi:hypothetical protein